MTSHYTIQLVTIKIDMKFQNPLFLRNIRQKFLYATINEQEHSEFLAYNKLDHPSCVYMYRLYKSQKSVTECFIGEKDSLTNRMNDKKAATDILIRRTISHTLKV